MTPKQILLIFLSLGFSNTKAQVQIRYQFTHLSPDQGLSSTYVRKIVQDPFGFIWIGTQDGLNRYDGKDLKIYNKGRSKESSLSGSDIRDLLIDSVRSTIWVITSYGGVDGINYITGKVWFHFEQQNTKQWNETLLNSLALADSKLYIGSSEGLLKLDLTKPGLQAVTIKNFDEYRASVDQLVFDKNTLWLFVENKGIFNVDIKRKNLLAAWKNSQLNGFKTYSATRWKKGIILGTSTGLKLVSRSGDSIGVITHSFPSISYSLNREIYACFAENDNAFLISDAHAVVRIYPDNGRYDVLKESTSSDPENWLSSVYSIFCDKDKNIWLGCQQGLLFSSPNPSPFYAVYKSSNSNTKISHCYYIFPKSDSVVFCCGQDGFFKLNPRNGEIISIKDGNPFYYAFDDHRGNLIVSSRPGSFVLKNKVLIPIESVYPEFKAFGTLVFNSHVKVNDSVILLGTENFKGLVIWNYKLRKVSIINTNSPGLQLTENVINTLYQDKDKNIWILGDHSISLLKRNLTAIRQITPYDALKKRYYSIFFDVTQYDQFYLIASYGNGVLMLDQNYQLIKEITAPKQLTANSVYKILPYKDSLLFVTSNNGLSVINLRRQSSTFYFSSDGLHSNTFEETSGNKFDDKLYAGGEKGLTVITPGLLKCDTIFPSVFLDEIRLERQNDVIKISDPIAKELVIPNDVVQTTISFCALDYTQSGKITYSYRIKELNNNWINLGARNVISLIGMAPGNYVIEVKATNGYHISGQPRIFQVRLLPKWYQTWLFRVGLVIVGCLILYLVYFNRISHLKKQEAIRRNIASDLHDDIGSTLNSIKIFTHLARTGDNPEKYMSQVEDSLAQTTSSLRDIIWVLNDSSDSLQGIAERIRKFAQPLCTAKGIEFKCYLQSDDKKVALSKEEKRNLLLIAKEAINNSVKHSGCSKIQVSFKSDNRSKSLEIADNGKGIDPGNPSTGDGLKNVNYRARQMNYHVAIQSSDKGTRIWLSSQGSKKGDMS